MSDLFDVRAGTCHFTRAALALAGAVSTYTTTGTQSYTIRGELYTVAAKAAVATPTLDGLTGVAFQPLAQGKQCLFAFHWNAAGDLVVTQGRVVNTADVVAGADALQLPKVPDPACPFAMLSIANANATPWQFGVGLWNAASLTLGAIRHYGWMPSQPFTAAT
jgi:hypothetical protein